MAVTKGGKKNGELGINKFKFPILIKQRKHTQDLLGTILRKVSDYTALLKAYLRVELLFHVATIVNSNSQTVTPSQHTQKHTQSYHRRGANLNKVNMEGAAFSCKIMIMAHLITSWPWLLRWNLPLNPWRLDSNHPRNHTST